MRTSSASRLYLLISAIMSLAHATMFTTYAIYYVQALGFGPLQLVLVGTVLEATIFLLEIPTGVVADVYSRRLSVLIGMFVLGAGYLLQGATLLLAPTLIQLAISFFTVVLIAEVIRGIGETLLSGALEAWIADEVGEEQVGALFLRAGQVGQAAGLVGIVLSVALAGIRLDLPYLMGGSLFVLLGVLLVRRMPETAFQPAPRTDRNTFSLMAATFQDGVAAVRGRPVLVLILLVGVVGGAALEGYDRLWEAHILTNVHLPGAIEPVVAFGFIHIIAAVLGIITVQVVAKRLHTNNTKVVTRGLLVLTGLRVLFILSLALASSFLWALLSLLALGVINSLSGPLYRTWLNQHIEGRVRATVLSMMGQTNALGQMAGGPIVGAVGARFSIRSALSFAAVLLAPAMGVYARALGRDEEDQMAS